MTSTYVSEHNHMAATSTIIFANGHFYYFQNFGTLAYTQGTINPTKETNKFILNSDSHLSNPYKYGRHFRDSIAERETFEKYGIKPGGYYNLENQILFFKKGKVYFQGNAFSKISDDAKNSW
jgi:hypothetical protein